MKEGTAENTGDEVAVILRGREKSCGRLAIYGPWASPSLAVACGASTWNSDTVSLLCRERLWV